MRSASSFNQRHPLHTIRGWYKPNTWPRGQQVQPQQQTQQQQQLQPLQQLLLNPPMGGYCSCIAISYHSTTPEGTAQVQRVPAPQTTPPTNNNLPTAHVNPIVIPARANQPLQFPPRTRNRHVYLALSPVEINNIAKPKFKCVGMQFIDDEDPLDVATGVVTSIVRHKKSKKLTFKYWNHQILDQEPTNPSDFEYIDLNYAVSNCKWSHSEFIGLLQKSC